MLGPRSVSALMLAIALALAAVSPAFALEDATKRAKPGASKSAPARGDFLFSDDKESKEAPKEQPAYVTALGFVSKIALVLILAYCTIYALKRFTGLRSVVGQGRQRIRVIENAGLAANRSLHLVEVGSRNYLVASTPNSVSLISEIDPQDLPETPEAEQQGGFGQQLAQFLGQRPDSGRSAQSVGDMLRESSTYLQDKVREVGGMRRKQRDA